MLAVRSCSTFDLCFLGSLARRRDSLSKIEGGFLDVFLPKLLYFSDVEAGGKELLIILILLNYIIPAST